MTGPRILLGGAPEGHDARLLLKELSRGAPVIHVARDDKRMEAMRAALAVMALFVMTLAGAGVRRVEGSVLVRVPAREDRLGGGEHFGLG